MTLPPMLKLLVKTGNVLATVTTNINNIVNTRRKRDCLDLQVDSYFETAVRCQPGSHDTNAVTKNTHNKNLKQNCETKFEESACALTYKLTHTTKRSYNANLDARTQKCQYTNKNCDVFHTVTSMGVTMPAQGHEDQLANPVTPTCDSFRTPTTVVQNTMNKSLLKLD